MVRRDVSRVCSFKYGVKQNWQFCFTEAGGPALRWFCANLIRSTDSNPIALDPV